MEKIKIDKEKIKEFVKKTRGTKQFNMLSLFFVKIDNQEYETILRFKPLECENIKIYDLDGASAIYYFWAGAGEFFIKDEEVPSIGYDEGYNYIGVYPRERVKLKTLYDMCQSLTDKFIDGLNQQQKLIEEAIKNGVKKNDDDDFENYEFETLVDEIADIWGNMGLLTLEEGWYSGYEEFQEWLGNILEEAYNKNYNVLEF